MITFNELLEIIDDGARTSYQKAADLHAKWVSDQTAPMRGTEPPKRRGRGPNRPKPLASTLSNVFAQDQ